MDADERPVEGQPARSEASELDEPAADSRPTNMHTDGASQALETDTTGMIDIAVSMAESEGSSLSPLESPDTSAVFDSLADATVDTIADTSVEITEDITEDTTMTSTTADGAAETPATSSTKSVTTTTTTTKRRRIARKSKDNPYGILPTSPFPDYIRPTFQECGRVHALLTKLHGNADRPLSMPAPSLTVAGCGEVPRVLDALVRTMLSGATTMTRANEALRRVVDVYGVDEGGSVCWESVAAGTTEDLQGAIGCAGLGVLKARNIMATLGMARESSPDGTLSLDYLHDMTTDAAMREMVRFPGVGVKTAACVSLFCLGRPCFAVDTHVLRLSGWLGWLPQIITKPRASRPKALQNAPGTVSMDDAFFHLDARIPNELKYGLHQLMIRHGQVCVRCQAATAEGTERWVESVCVLEDMMGGRVKRKVKVKETAKKKSKEAKEEDEEDVKGEEAMTKDEASLGDGVVVTEKDVVMAATSEDLMKEEVRLQAEIKVAFEATPGARVTRAMARKGCVI
jgi:endonuclease III